MTDVPPFVHPYAERVPVASFWKHGKTRGSYVVVALAEVEADLAPVVVYKGAYSGRTFTRPCSEFLDGRFIQVERLEHVA